MSNRRYYYFRNKEIPGVVSAAADLSEDRTTLRIAFALCMPADIFSKKKAHTILDGRLDTNKGKFVTTTEFTGRSVDDVIRVFNNLPEDQLPRYWQDALLEHGETITFNMYPLEMDEEYSGN